jgi:hypothetical protein
VTYVMTKDDLNKEDRLVQIMPAPPGLTYCVVSRYHDTDNSWGEFRRETLPVVGIGLELSGFCDLVVPFNGEVQALAHHGFDGPNHHPLGLFVASAPTEDDWRQAEADLAAKQEAWEAAPHGSKRAALETWRSRQ